MIIPMVRWRKYMAIDFYLSITKSTAQQFMLCGNEYLVRVCGFLLPVVDVALALGDGAGEGEARAALDLGH